MSSLTEKMAQTGPRKPHLNPFPEWSQQLRRERIKNAFVIKKMVHIYDGILLSQKETNNAICSDMNGPRDDHTEWSKSDRERQISYDIAYLWNLKKKSTNELTYKTEIQM